MCEKITRFCLETVRITNKPNPKQRLVARIYCLKKMSVNPILFGVKRPECNWECCNNQYEKEAAKNDRSSMRQLSNFTLFILMGGLEVTNKDLINVINLGF
jgi:hypothetical protein